MTDRTQVAPKMLDSYERDSNKVVLYFKYTSDARRMEEAINAEYSFDSSSEETTPEQPTTDEGMTITEYPAPQEVHSMNIGAANARYLKSPITLSYDSTITKPEDAIRTGFATHKDWGLENVQLLTASREFRVHYPAGTSAPSDNGTGGAGFYSRYPSLVGSEAAVLRYEVRFPLGFDFVKGGKLPGLYGGDAPSGGDSTDSGFTTRMMWRTDGQGELYLYCVNKDNPYGQSIGRGMFNWPTGEWAVIEQEIILNDPSSANGIARIWVNGKPVFEVVDVIYRTKEEVTIDGLMFSTFFGGSSESWRTPVDQFADFRNFEIYSS